MRTADINDSQTNLPDRHYTDKAQWRPLAEAPKNPWGPVGNKVFKDVKKVESPLVYKMPRPTHRWALPRGCSASDCADAGVENGKSAPLQGRGNDHD